MHMNGHSFDFLARAHSTVRVDSCPQAKRLHDSARLLGLCSGAWRRRPFRRRRRRRPLSAVAGVAWPALTRRRWALQGSRGTS